MLVVVVVVVVVVAVVVVVVVVVAKNMVIMAEKPAARDQLPHQGRVNLLRIVYPWPGMGGPGHSNVVIQAC